MGSIQTLTPTFSLIQRPPGYPKIPTPGKLELLWNANYVNLYHRLSPYSGYNSSLLNIFGDNEPFIYTYIDQSNQAPNSLIPYESTAFPMGSAPQDVIRVSKFMASGRGIAFLATQLLLQTGNAFNETRIYNPTSPIVAAGMALVANQVRPTRFIDISGGIQGIATSLLGNVGQAVGSAIFGAAKTSPPPGTLPAGLTTFNQNDSKGLLRAQTANTAKSLLESKWPISSAGGSGPGGLLSMVSNLATGLFANILPQTQTGITIRSDEGTYGRMVAAGSQPNGTLPTRFGYNGNSQPFDFMQRWIAGGTLMRKKNESPSEKGIIVSSLNGVDHIVIGTSNTINFVSIGGSAEVPIVPSTNTLKPGIRYEDGHFPKIQDPTQGSDIMLGWSDYENTAKKFPSKQTDATSTDVQNVDTLNFTLKKVIDAIKAEGVYAVNIPDASSIVRPGTYNINGYDRLLAVTGKNPPGSRKDSANYPSGALSEYRKSSATGVDSSIDGSAVGSYKLPTNGRFDAINTLNVLTSDKTIANSPFKGWRVWDTYRDDLIAFYFYDVVNTRFIPFRATIKGVAENANATWEELSFIGRSDRVYSYGGFTRNLSFTFHIEIGSIVELAPTYQRLNYLNTLYKPANYTYASDGAVFSKFVVPPMVMVTIGDLYKDQPCLIQSLTNTIPDDSLWETSNESNSTAWSYLSSYIKTTNPNILYGQLPRSIEVAISLILLEKERPIVGGANFSHAPRTTDAGENWGEWNTDIPLGGATPSKLGQSLVVEVNKG